MGLFGDAINFVGDTIDTVVNTISGTSETIDSIGDSVVDTIDSVGDSVGGTEDTVNEGVQETTETVDVPLDEGTEGLFDMLAGGVQSIEGFFHAIGGAFEWVRDTAVPIIPIAGARDVMTVIFDGGAGLFHGIAGFIGGIRAFFDFLAGLSGVEGAVFLIGIFLIFLAGYMVVSSLGFQIFDASIVGVTGIGLVAYAAANLVGALILTGVGLSLLGLAILGDRGTFFMFGIPITLIGLVMLFTTLLPGQYLATFILTAGTMFGVIYGTEYLENRLGPRVGSDRPLLVGGD